ncbi:uncharacterized protein LOC135217420 [Macrobrachium nipponense]|uniref:uncharacterized protein LOC135217420 n=1 Tax=Macrobrachium nipponense TaxID=159736 RepID=UPI0030C87791
MAYSKSTYLGEERLYYFSGKVRAFWKDKVFFLDQKNAAIVGFEKLYINGHRASQTDLHTLHAVVEDSDWNTSPDLYSYVVKYSSNEVHPWPYKLKGKVLWFAYFAWIGTIPKAVEQQLERYNVVYMPVSYYTGKLTSVFANKLLLFGDSRNSVMVQSRDLSFYGQNVDCREALLNVEHHAPLIHAFIISLQFLTNENFEGPKPHIPTCPVDKNSSTTWLAKFAWVGEMPYEYKQLLKRFQIIEINEWNSLCQIGGNVQYPLSSPENCSQGTLFSVPEGAKGNRNRTRTVAEPLLVSTQKGPAIVKGLLLAASNDYGLINSSLDVVIFSVENFYVDGEIYRDGKPLDEFFHDRSVSLTVWKVPLKEPVLVFDIYVMWRAVCVWFGIPPKNMEAIKKCYYNGTISGSVPQALNTTSDKRYTLVLGRITSISYNYGYAIAEVGNTTIDISFKRKALYMKGYKLHSKCNLLEIKGDLEASIWSMLVYPVNNDSEVMYAALALWEETYQHYVSSDLLYRILLEGRNVAPEDFHAPEVAESSDKSEDDKIGLHMTGMIVKTTPEYGIIETKSITIEPSYVFFSRANFFIDGTVPDVHQMLHQVDKKRQVNLYARSTKYQIINGYPVTMQATLAWMGKKSSESKRLSSKMPVELPVGGKSAIEHNEVNLINTKANLSSQEGSVKKALKLIKTNSPVMEHRRGRFAQLQNRYGVIQCGFEGKGCSTYVLFDFSVVWIDGDRVELHESLDDSIIEDEVQCNLLAYEISAVKVGSFQVNMQASAVWLGKKPSHIALPEVQSPLKAMEAIVQQDKGKPEVKRKPMKKYLIKKQGNECKNISKKLSNVKLTNKKGLVPVSLEDIADSLDKPHVGKHVTGRILKLMKGCGIAMWSCAAKEGEVYMFFFKKNVYVNLCPMDESYKVDKSKIFNFYVLPVLHKTLGVYRISLYATCGWKGSKPHDIPVPGEQDHARITLDNVYALEVKMGRTVPAYIVKLKGNKGIARWRSQPHGGDIFIEFNKSITCDNIKTFFDKGLEDEENPRPCLFHVRPIEHKEIGDYVVSLTATCGWLGKKPAHFPKPKTNHEPTLLGQKLHVRPVPLDILEAAAAMAIGDAPDPGQLQTKEEGLSALDSVEADLNKSLGNKEKKRNKLEIWENDEIDEITMEGVIVELYSNVGRLQGGDGKQHFFSRENSYLYGVCLNYVELWHVLVQDEIVSYKLTEVSTGESKISKMWIGPENVAVDEAVVHINEWCNKYSVPDGAKELLIHQLELSQDSSEKEKNSSEKEKKVT